MPRLYTIAQKILLLGLLISGALALPAMAQCSATNTAFQSGEVLSYDLYFNWKFVWVRVGTASMDIASTRWGGQPAYRTHLITRGNARADKLFILRDTLTAYVAHDLTPLHYTKHAREGKAYYTEEATYSYPHGRCHVDMRYDRSERREHRTATYESAQCAFDMVSMMLRARSFDPTGWQKGHRIKFIMAGGKRCEPEYIVFRGRENFTVESTNAKYRCLVFSFMEPQKDGREKEIIRFYITDDANHLPVRLDMNLNFGTAKAFLSASRGVRNPQTSLQK